MLHLCAFFLIGGFYQPPARINTFIISPYYSTVTDLAKFLIAVKACKNDVFFDSNEGDILNLASTLSQYVFCSIAGKESILENGSVRCVNEEDYSLLADFLCED